MIWEKLLPKLSVYSVSPPCVLVPVFVSKSDADVKNVAMAAIAKAGNLRFEHRRSAVCNTSEEILTVNLILVFVVCVLANQKDPVFKHLRDNLVH